jgi:hypothetical protein
LQDLLPAAVEKPAKKSGLTEVPTEEDPSKHETTMNKRNMFELNIETVDILGKRSNYQHIPTIYKISL